MSLLEKKSSKPLFWQCYIIRIQTMSNYKLAILFFLSTSILFGQFFVSCKAKCHVDDESGLLGFKSGIVSDPSGILTTWKSGTDCCSWAGVECRLENRVTELSLSAQPGKPNATLSGTLSASLAKLHNLTGIYFHDLNIYGGFPNFISKMPNLHYVYIENMKLSGSIPETVGKLTQLEALSLAGNRFSGPIPSSIGALTQLTQLKLGNNLLMGVIPSSLQQLKNLTYLSLEQNKLSGSIPDFFTAFNNLRILNLTRNKLSGNMPRSISSLAPTLAYLELGHNALTGQIPEFLGQFKAMDTLDLSWNRFSGTVPKTFNNLTKIFNLDLSHNTLTDPFPAMNVKGIESLDLSHNKFHLGSIPKWVTTSPIIYSLKLAKCGIKMKLDDWKPVETYFYDYIDLSDNEITGSPVALLNRTEFLIAFYASGNKLKFNFENMKFPKSLKYLDLSRNLVFGKVPKAVSGLSMLNVSHNHLCGLLPATSFPAASYAGNDCLCGSPLPPCKA